MGRARGLGDGARGESLDGIHFVLRYVETGGLVKVFRM